MNTSRTPLTNPASSGGLPSTWRGKLRGAALVGAFLAAGAVVHDARGGEPLHVKDVKLVSPSEGVAEVFVATTGTPQFSARVEGSGRRLLIALEGADVAGAPGAITEGNAVVGGVMTQAVQQNGQSTTRILVNLAHAAEYRIVPEAGGLRIVLSSAAQTAPVGATGLPPTAAAPKRTDVGDVRFDHQAGYDRIVIALSARADFTQSQDGGRTTVEISGVHLADSLQRKLDTTAFGGPVRAVSTYRRKSMPDHVVIEIERSGDASGVVTREGNDLVILVGKGRLPSSVSGIASDGGVARRAVTVAREEDLRTDAPRVTTTFDAGAGAQESMVEPNQADAFLPTFAGQQRRYTGQRINVELKDASIHEVLRLLSDVGHVNIVVAENVTGTVTVRMRNVPWDQALDTVLQAKGLGMVRQGNMIRVAPLADLNKERELAIARRKAELQLAPVETRLIPVYYAEAAHMAERAKELLSPRGSLSVDERTNVLIARDVPGNLAQIDDSSTPSTRRRPRCSSRRAWSRPRASTSATWASSGAATGP